MARIVLSQSQEKCPVTISRSDTAVGIASAIVLDCMGHEVDKTISIDIDVEARVYWYLYLLLLRWEQGYEEMVLIKIKNKRDLSRPC